MSFVLPTGRLVPETIGSTARARSNNLNRNNNANFQQAGD
jgi:hypothetical protein